MRIEMISGAHRYTALADPTRREILRMLRNGSRAAGEIAREFHQTQPTISHHLRILDEAGFVRSERRGASVVYTLQASALEELAAELMDLAAGLRARARRKKGAMP
jgi:DNA-binding transcriptional ArsR family regulator